MNCPSSQSICLHSTGVEWDEERLARRYAFLRGIRSEVRLDLLYYPYWLLELRGRAAWRFFGEKPVDMLLISDGRSGHCRRISAPPALREERLHPVETDAPEKGSFLPARLEKPESCGSSGARDARAHVAPALLGEEEATREAESFALKAWTRRCNLPLGPRAELACTERKAVFLHKPFWIMTPDRNAEPRGGKLFIFDASTGLGGLSEYWSIAEYIMFQSTVAPSAD